MMSPSMTSSSTLHAALQVSRLVDLLLERGMDEGSVQAVLQQVGGGLAVT